tara:strand:+ start:224 stop:1165 length:942 start_codon:yes stop_codon:yes gene_type:complete
MKINVSNWCEPHFDSKKLPTVEQLRTFFECIDTSPEEVSTGFFYKVPKHDYERQNGYRRERYPRFGNSSDWIVPSLADIEGPLSSKIDCLVGSEHYNKGETSYRKIPPTGLTLPTTILKEIETSTAAACTSQANYIKSIKDMHGCKSHVENFIRTFMGHEIDNFKKALSQKKYIQTSTHTNIIEKIDALRKVTSEPIYIMADTPLLDYLFVHQYAPGQLFPNVWLVQSSSGSYSYRNDDDLFSGYKSAVFTTSQMKGSHEFELYWQTQRGHRVWNVYFALIGKLGLDIPTDPLENPGNEVKFSDNHPRWGRLF